MRCSPVQHSDTPSQRPPKPFPPSSTFHSTPLPPHPWAQISLAPSALSLGDSHSSHGPRSHSQGSPSPAGPLPLACSSLFLLFPGFYSGGPNAHLSRGYYRPPMRRPSPGAGHPCAPQAGSDAVCPHPSPLPRCPWPAEAHLCTQASSL